MNGLAKEADSAYTAAAKGIGRGDIVQKLTAAQTDYREMMGTIYDDAMKQALRKNPEDVGRLFWTSGNVSEIEQLQKMLAIAHARRHDDARRGDEALARHDPGLPAGGGARPRAAAKWSETLKADPLKRRTWETLTAAPGGSQLRGAMEVLEQAAKISGRGNPELLGESYIALQRASKLGLGVSFVTGAIHPGMAVIGLSLAGLTRLMATAFTQGNKGVLNATMRALRANSVGTAAVCAGAAGVAARDREVRCGEQHHRHFRRQRWRSAGARRYSRGERHACSEPQSEPQRYRGASTEGLNGSSPHQPSGAHAQAPPDRHALVSKPGAACLVPLGAARHARLRAALSPRERHRRHQQHPASGKRLMADSKKISELTALAQATVDYQADLLPIVDVSVAVASRNKSITPDALVKAALAANGITVDGRAVGHGSLATIDFSINTNKFTVAAATGNTLVAGTLGATGPSRFVSTHTASATRYITLTGSNGANPVMDVSAGSLLGSDLCDDQWRIDRIAQRDTTYSNNTLRAIWTALRRWKQTARSSDASPWNNGSRPRISASLTAATSRRATAGRMIGSTHATSFTNLPMRPRRQDSRTQALPPRISMASSQAGR
jgi:hypothetical protein